MGNTFRYIHDSALYTVEDEIGDPCNFCNTTTDPVYSYWGYILQPDLAADPELARTDPDVFQLCSKCTLTSHVQKHVEPSLLKTINQFANNKQLTLEQFHRTPDIPRCVQGMDWPICCGEWCEFIGVPSSYDESRVIPDNYEYWNFEPKPWYEDCVLEPEELSEISLFQCFQCKKKHFIFQCT